MSIAGPRPRRSQPAREEAEKPFWISFSDLMTALMVLFLVAMTVALLAITNDISETEQKEATREEEISEFLDRLQLVTRDFPGVTLRGPVLDFGDRARFDTNSHRLNEAQARLLRAFVPRILDLARDPLGEKWLKRVVVEGFADARGGYLHNLHLSLLRSERVLCALLLAPTSLEALSDTDRRLVRDLFLVGGASFNGLKSSPEESRRIELRLEFLETGEPRLPGPLGGADQDLHCPLDRS